MFRGLSEMNTIRKLKRILNPKLKRILNPIIREPIITLLVFLLVVLLTVFVIVIFSKQPQWIYNLLGIASTGESKYEALKVLGISMGGILIALQALMSYRRAKALEETARAQADAVLKTEDGQRQDRLKNAIEHLGHESESVRLGGAYELFHLAEDTKELRQTVLDILCAHIRRSTSMAGYRKAYELKPSEEIQSLLRVLFVQQHLVFRGLDINLQGSWLKGADLRKARLWSANLTQTQLQRSRLDAAHMQNANLTEAHLEEACLQDAWMHGANLFCVQMQGANLSNVHLMGSNLIGTHLQGAFLSNVNLQGAFLGEVSLHCAYLENAQMQGVRLSSLYLLGASLSGAQLQGAGGQNWTSSTPFADRIRESIGKDRDLSKCILVFSGIEQNAVDQLVLGMSDDKARMIRVGLNPHIGKPTMFGFPDDCEISTGSYTEEDAEKWIAEYEEAVSEYLGDDN